MVKCVLRHIDPTSNHHTPSPNAYRLSDAHQVIFPQQGLDLVHVDQAPAWRLIVHDRAVSTHTHTLSDAHRAVDALARPVILLVRLLLMLCWDLGNNFTPSLRYAKRCRTCLPSGKFVCCVRSVCVSVCTYMRAGRLWKHYDGTMMLRGISTVGQMRYYVD